MGISDLGRRAGRAHIEGARRVVAAAREGGVLGIGVAEVSSSQRDTLQSTADALGGGAC